MNTHSEKTGKNNSIAVANNLSPVKDDAASSFQLQQGNAYQEMANNSPRVKQLRAYQEMANDHVAAQHKEHSIQPAMPAAGTPVVQREWVRTKEDFEWDQLINGVQWYSTKEGDMYYEIIDKSQIRKENLKAVEDLENQKQTRQFWLEKSAGGFDLLAKMNKAIVDKKQDAKGLLDTKELTVFETASNFKDMFVSKNKLLAVFRSSDSSGAIEEVKTLTKIKEKGFLTPDPVLIDVIHKGEKKIAILMNKIGGTFIDIAKTKDPTLVINLLKEAVSGNAVKMNEHNMYDVMSKIKNKPSEPRHDLLKNLLQDLKLLLASSKDMVINDLQIIVKPDGRAVIIDPQWAGDIATLTSDNERKFIEETYDKIQKAVDALSKKLPKDE